MDDGIELNIAPPSSGDRLIRQHVGLSKGGRWTDRVKAKREARDAIRNLVVTRPTTSTDIRPGSSGQHGPIISTQIGHLDQSVRPSGSSKIFQHPPSSHSSHPQVRPVDQSIRQPQSRSISSSVEHSAARSQQSNVHSSTTIVDRRDSTSGSRTTNFSSHHVSATSPPSTRPSQDSHRSHPQSTSSKSKAPQIISSLFTSNPLPPQPTKREENKLGAPSNAPLDTTTFSGLGLDPMLVRHLEGKLSISRPTAIQRSSLPYLLSSPLDIDSVADIDEEDHSAKTEEDKDKLRDVFIQSQTGSGKTLSFLLPIIQTLLPLSKLSYIDRSIGTLAIILAPTRELAQQISKVLESILALSLSTNTDDHYARWLVSGLLTGGSTRTHEKARLRKGVPILVSTPGRLLDHLQNTSAFKCAKTMFLVLDEADRLMDLGFEETINGIIRALEGRRRIEIKAEEDSEGGVMKWPYWSRGRRTILCSATVDSKVEKLAGVALKDPVVFRASNQQTTSAKEEFKNLINVMDEVERLKEETNKVVFPLTNGEKFTPPSQLSQKYVVVPTKLRMVTLVALLRSLTAQRNEAGTKIIVFLSSTDGVDYHWKLLGGVSMDGSAPHTSPLSTTPHEQDDDEVVGDPPKQSSPSGITKEVPSKQKKSQAKEIVALTSPLLPHAQVYRLHGSLPLRTRLSSLAAFSAPSSNPAILLATSVASRGLDLPLVRAVVQYDLPTEGGANEYVHRVGRTARAGKGGEAWAFVGPSEVDWVNWVEGKMGGADGNTKDGVKGDVGEVKLGQVGVEDVLKKGFGGKGYEYEQRATDAQLAMERWVLADDQNASLARKAFASFVRAYSTHPTEEKRFFHPKSLHLGHLAKSFALREAPSSLVPSINPKRSSDPRKRKRAGSEEDTSFKRSSDSRHKKQIGLEDDTSFKRLSESRHRNQAGQDEDRHGGKEESARNETERRMYEAVRKAGRMSKVGGVMGRFSSKGMNEFQVVGGDEVERMVSRK
ncbi:hypothetical protein M231_01812 [Tremella mesenterica]|uniref:ATP-dependent RNA helicase n=1 Tax=Tremella mesenterica TaxID=5217 RepID=A0A4Q1BSF8_TREME|nr:hypothetical protein M231_01812 [Tremella mesenterica]